MYKYIKYSNEPKSSEIQQVFKNLTTFINNQLEEDEGYRERFTLVKSKKVESSDDDAIYNLTIKDSKGNMFRTKVRLFYDEDADEWYDAAEVIDVDDALNEIYSDYIDSLS